MKKNVLLVIVLLGIVGLGVEINEIVENGLKEVEELVFSLLLICFWLLLIMYVFNRMYLNTPFKKKQVDKHHTLQNFNK